MLRGCHFGLTSERPAWKPNITLKPGCGWGFCIPLPSQTSKAALPLAKWSTAPSCSALCCHSAECKGGPEGSLAESCGDSAGPRMDSVGGNSLLQAPSLGWIWCPPHAVPGAFLTHVTLVVPAVLPLLVGIAHAAVAVDVDVTWGSEGLSQEPGLLGKGEAGMPSPPSPQGYLVVGNLLEGKPPPKNMLKRSSGEMSASKPRWKSPCPWPCRAAWLLSSPNWSYCFLFSGLLSTAYAVPMAGGEEERSGLRILGCREGSNGSRVLTFLRYPSSALGSRHLWGRQEAWPVWGEGMQEDPSVDLGSLAGWRVIQAPCSLQDNGQALSMCQAP